MKFDIDIDVQSGLDLTRYGTRASIYNEKTEKFLPHNSGVYVDEVPVDPITGRCSVPYKEADELNYHKIDLLTNTVYDQFKSKEELLEALEREPDWNLLQKRSVIAKLPHISNHGDVVERLEPQSVEDLADVLALIRPGKKHLLDEYIENRVITRKKLYLRPTNGQVYFKKSHAISYAMMIKAVLNSPKINHGILW